jgi:hypothetical protein
MSNGMYYEQRKNLTKSSRCFSFFCTPVHSPRRHALPVLLTSLFEHRSTPPSPVQTGSAVSAGICDGINRICLRMLVRGTVHGMQVPLNGMNPGALPKVHKSLVVKRKIAFAFVPTEMSLPTTPQQAIICSIATHFHHRSSHLTGEVR